MAREARRESLFATMARRLAFAAEMRREVYLIRLEGVPAGEPDREDGRCGV